MEGGRGHCDAVMCMLRPEMMLMEYLFFTETGKRAARPSSLPSSPPTNIRQQALGYGARGFGLTYLTDFFLPLGT